MEKGDEVTMILVDNDYNFLGKANYDRWNKLPWYKRIFGFIYCYKNQFIDMEGFDIKPLGALKKEDFRIECNGEEIEIGNFQDLGNGSYIVEPKFLK